MFQAVVQVDGGGRDGQGGIPFGSGGCDPDAQAPQVSLRLGQGSGQKPEAMPFRH
jgi:hypothetical protein